MRPDPKDSAQIWDMIHAAREAAGFVSGMTLERFMESPLAQRAVERDVEIIGEAASRISPEFRAAHPDIPWRPIIAQRNVLAHDYGRVDPARIWRLVREDLPELVRQLEAVAPSGNA